ncbi:hypothetical protein F2Q70_00034916 [Brassica cretica]|uniref:Uncharacterized protein n=1 Tax=Brassica cretica TaxID=69181 RepID=A0A8S9K0Q8_BRACR|nr:hypothetical protein F2Q70_00034916 [Brassica cretica]
MSNPKFITDFSHVFKLIEEKKWLGLKKNRTSHAVERASDQYLRREGVEAGDCGGPSDPGRGKNPACLEQRQVDVRWIKLRKAESSMFVYMTMVF